ncbi:unnamed protein product [Vitrella brassicaformis CCMP3155]|uniref:Uncharacterized protein n=1 Tax=Vitrella brassicaformis (strain CCMP3155) TaxID=1169540 RepID=A0A0G4EAQ3_VITBC|nr:unnamed protein product [Vitrella brassicaformis CCMP3155]|eukprot:CEL92367.1 unnamed protein product [Vitrella brassicaformis CCMP3155]
MVAESASLADKQTTSTNVHMMQSFARSFKLKEPPAATASGVRPPDPRRISASSSAQAAVSWSTPGGLTQKRQGAVKKAGAGTIWRVRSTELKSIG